MNFLKFDIGVLGIGRVVEVTLSGDAANVRLLDEENMYAYSRGRSFDFIGGKATKSPVILKTPSYAHWYVVVDMAGGLEGEVDAKVKVV